MGLFKNRPKRKSAPIAVAKKHSSAPADRPQPAALEAELRQQISILEENLEESRRQQAKDTKRFLLGVLDAIDAFDRVFQSVQNKEELVTPQMKVWIGNFRTISRLLQNALAGQGATPFQKTETEFDAEWHEIVETIADSTQPNGTILREVHKGYHWRNQLLRKAAIVVAYREEAAAESPQKAALEPQNPGPEIANAVLAESGGGNGQSAAAPTSDSQASEPAQ